MRECELVRRAGGHQISAMLPGPRTQVDHIVRALDHLLVVLHDDHRVPEVAQPLQRVDQLDVVPLMKADARLVEDIEDAHELRADLRCEPDALPFPSGERPRGTIERKVIEPHIQKKLEPLPDLLEDRRGDGRLPLRAA